MIINAENWKEHTMLITDEGIFMYVEATRTFDNEEMVEGSRLSCTAAGFVYSTYSINYRKSKAVICC